MAAQGFSATDTENIEALARVAFNSLDSNGLGRITKTQFKEGFVDFITSAGFSRPSDAFINEYFKKFDTDQSGDLDFQEFKVYMADAINKMIESVPI